MPNGVEAQRYLVNHEKPSDFPKDSDAKVFLFFGSGYYANENAASFLRDFSRLHNTFLVDNKIYIMVAGSVYKNKFLKEIYCYFFC